MPFERLLAPRPAFPAPERLASKLQACYKEACHLAGTLRNNQMDQTIPTAILRAARENAGLNQTALAVRLGVSGSVLSRLEKADTTDRTMAWRYLEAVGTQESAAIQEFFTLGWRISERPAFHHPDRTTLWDVEQALQDLETFER